MSAVVPYEVRLGRDARWALHEGSSHFERRNAVFGTLGTITRRLVDLDIPHAVAGAIAMFLHGYRRFTEDINLVVTPDGLRTIHERLVDHGYVRPDPSRNYILDAITGVRVEFLIAGRQLGVGLPSTVVVPHPAAVGMDIDGVACVGLATLIELKLATGTVPGRMKHVADIQEMIRVLRLPENLSQQLDSSLRSTYRRLWAEMQNAPPDE